MKTAIVYRTQAQALKSDFEKSNPLAVVFSSCPTRYASTVEKTTASYNAADEPQFEMCVFTDGRVAQRWLVGAGSCVWWDSIEHLYKVHIYSHPDYGTRVEWSDGEIEQL